MVSKSINSKQLIDCQLKVIVDKLNFLDEAAESSDSAESSP